MLIATDHSAYDYDFIVEHSQLVLDTRNATKNVTQGGTRSEKHSGCTSAGVPQLKFCWGSNFIPCAADSRPPSSGAYFF